MQVDFTVRNEGSIVLLHPHTAAAREWAEENISAEGYQPMWPTVVMEPRYTEAVLAGITDAGLEIA